jgi:hypothetical protein
LRLSDSHSGAISYAPVRDRVRDRVFCVREDLLIAKLSAGNRKILAAGEERASD